MSLHCEKSVEIEKTDNGYILSWEDETRNDRDDITGEWPRRQVKTRGREVFTSKEKALKRASEIL